MSAGIKVVMKIKKYHAMKSSRKFDKIRPHYFDMVIGFVSRLE